MLTALRIAAVAVLVTVLIAVQNAALRHFSIDGTVPNLALLIVVAAGIVRGSDYGAGLGLMAGLLLDLVPPATGTAGRWALALVIVGYLAGQVSADVQRSLRLRLLLVAGCSFLATSVFALSGVILGDTHLNSWRMPRIIVEGSLIDVVAALIVLPLAMMLFTRLRPVREIA